jgi:hypothetical protein
MRSACSPAPGAGRSSAARGAVDAAGAVRLSRELLPDLERVLGPAHRDTLTTRNNIAYCVRMLTEKGGQ